MSRQKEFFMVLDTETLNSVEQPIPYDLGYAICDRHGNIYEEKSFVIAETFLDMSDVMASAYYANKIPSYWEDIKSGKRVIKTLWNVHKEFKADIEKYNIKKIGAYNMGFDKRALNNLMRYVSKSWCRWWFPYEIEFFDIWNCACDLLLARRSYINFALENGFVSDKGNILTSAECAYRYIVNDVNFEEEHKGLEDVRIEVEILAKCYKQHKKMDTTLNSACWRKVQTKRKELEL